MSFGVRLWTASEFKKRKNSTKIPSPSTGHLITGLTLKEETSVEKPTFILNWANQTADIFNISYLNFHGEYYFIDDIKLIRNNLYELSCELDVGATYKSDIGSYTAFIERSSSSYSSLLPDPNVAIKNNEVIYSTTTPVGTLFNSGGYYVITVLNDLGSGAGFTSYYITDRTNLEALSRYVNTDWGSGASDLLDWFQATFLHTSEAIVDCNWLPFSFQSLPGGPISYETMKVGVDVVPNCSGYRLTGIAVKSWTYNITIPHRYSDFRKGAPYTTGKLFIPGYGTIDFNPLNFPDDKIYFRFDADLVTGDIACYIMSSTNKVISSLTYNVAVACPVGKVGQNISGLIGGTAATIGGIASLVATGGASGIAGVASGINSIASSAAPTMSVHGGKGGRALAANGLDIICSIITKDTADPSALTATEGRPLMSSATISNLSGYIKCSNASVPIGGRAGDKEAVNNLLNGGFYYE